MDWLNFMIAKMNKYNKKAVALTISLTVLNACTTVVPQKATLRSIDQPAEENKTAEKQVLVKKSASQIRDAYKTYLSKSAKKDLSRRTALNRLAELEFEVSNQLANNQTLIDEENTDQLEKLQAQKLDRTIDLLTTSLNDYPKAKGNDKVLYQLAKAQDQRGFYLKSIDTLSKLVNLYPKSKYYIESQFRIAEANFSLGDYSSAENGYTEVLISPRNHKFYEKAIFKRGWSRFKQSYYQDAIDDYIQAVKFHNFDPVNSLNQSEKNLFDEYFRAIGLSFTILGGQNTLKEFFNESKDFNYEFITYSVVSDLYLKQERYSDSVQVLKQFISENPHSTQASLAQLKVVEVWQKSNFVSKLNEEIESFYINYNKNNKHWKNTESDNLVYKESNEALRKYVLLVAEYFHSLNQQKSTSLRYSKAKKWYNRFLNDYSSYAQKDNVYFQYAELLSVSGHSAEALKFYELAAYDGNLVLDKQSAYATILLTAQLYSSEKKSTNKTFLLTKHLKYSLLFAELYRDDSRNFDVLAHAIELAYASGDYLKSIELANLLDPAKASSKKQKVTFYEVSLLKAQSYLNLDQFAAAETVYSSLQQNGTLKKSQHTEITKRMALTVYNLANKQKKKNLLVEASKNFMRVSEISKTSKIAITGIYDAIAIYMSNQSWQQAITAIKKMQSSYPNNRFSKDVTKKLSIAYLKSDQGLKAAEQFEKISSFEQNQEVRMAALWQAAEIYENNKNYVAAVRSYSEYANTFKKPYPQYVESMQKLVTLYQKINNKKLLTIWRNRILNGDKQRAPSEKTDRTNFVVASTNLILAKESNDRFNRLKLVEPLQKNLKAKKSAMQKAIKFYGRASNYGIADITTESTYSIANIYRSFSTALLESERPKKLTGEDLEQYNILLEDQAFPFEDKAIEFHEINISRIKDGIFNDSISNSISELKELFPVKYNRKNKIEGYIDVL